MRRLLPLQTEERSANRLFGLSPDLILPGVAMGLLRTAPGNYVGLVIARVSKVSLAWAVAPGPFRARALPSPGNAMPDEAAAPGRRDGTDMRLL
jgi:hypothetical protein